MIEYVFFSIKLKIFLGITFHTLSLLGFLCAKQELMNNVGKQIGESINVSELYKFYNYLQYQYK